MNDTWRRQVPKFIHPYTSPSWSWKSGRIRKVKWWLVDRSVPPLLHVPPLIYERVHAPSYTSTCSHAVWPVHTRVLRWRGGEGVARQLQHHRCCCCLQSGVLYCQPCRGLANAIHRASRSCCASVRQSTISLSGLLLLLLTSLRPIQQPPPFRRSSSSIPLLPFTRLESRLIHVQITRKSSHGRRCWSVHADYCSNSEDFKIVITFVN